MAAVLHPAAVSMDLAAVRPSALMLWLGVARIGFGLFKPYRPAHPRFLARVQPKQRLRFSCLMALCHCGSPLMMLGPLASPMMLLNMTAHSGHAFVPRTLRFALLALTLPEGMGLALPGAASLTAWIVWRRLRLAALTRIWVNLDGLWALLFVLMEIMQIATVAAPSAAAAMPAWSPALLRSDR